MKSNALPRQIVVTRFMEYRYKCVKEQLGFIPDILKIARKYRLDNFMLICMQTETFPSKIPWTKIVKENVYSQWRIQGGGALGASKVKHIY